MYWIAPTLLKTQSLSKFSTVTKP